MKGKIYYSSLEQDVVQARDPDYKLPEDYHWLSDHPHHEAISRLLRAPFKIYGWGYTKLYLRMEIVGQEKLEPYKKRGIFLYMNHTQETGDPFLPNEILSGRYYYGICAPANLSIPLLGKMLPMLGALPIPEGRQKMKEFREAVAHHIENGKVVVIFPEAHVWPWYTKIRPFSDVSFQFPCELNAPCFCATLVYRHDEKKRPKTVCYIDGPYVPDESLSRRQKRACLHDQIENRMKARANTSNAAYIEYEQYEDIKK